MKILRQISLLRENSQKAYAILIDPDKVSPSGAVALAKAAQRAHASFLLVGGSLLTTGEVEKLVVALKAEVDLPVILFPGSAMQVTPAADAILLLSLISGRNPELLIGAHVAAAPLLQKSGLEIIPTGYMLIDSGHMTTAHYMSGTLPIPADKPEIAAMTALAGQMLGLGLIYLDGGSGAAQPVDPRMIAEVSKTIDRPLVVGGGIRSAETAARAFEAGADLLIIGNALEKPGGAEMLAGLSQLVVKSHQNVPG